MQHTLQIKKDCLLNYITNLLVMMLYWFCLWRKNLHLSMRNSKWKKNALFKSQHKNLSSHAVDLHFSWPCRALATKRRMIRLLQGMPHQRQSASWNQTNNFHNPKDWFRKLNTQFPWTLLVFFFQTLERLLGRRIPRLVLLNNSSNPIYNLKLQPWNQHPPKNHFAHLLSSSQFYQLHTVYLHAPPATLLLWTLTAPP